MSARHPSDHDVMDFQSCLSSFCGGGSRPFGDTRKVALGNNEVGMASAIRESVDKAFGGISLEEQLAEDTAAYQLRLRF